MRRSSSAYPHVLGMLTLTAVEPLIGAPYLSVANWLRRFDAWPAERRVVWQRRRLDDVIERAAARVPFYRSLLGGRGAGIELTDLPVVDKLRMRADPEAFRSADRERMTYVRKATAGTTGDPWQYELDRRPWAHIRGAQLHLWEQTGYRYGDRIVVLGTPPSLVAGGTRVAGRLRAMLERRVYSAAGIRVDHSASLDRARRAVAAGGMVWYGYATMVAAMAQAVLDEGFRLCGPTAIITTSEPLQPAWRAQIEQAFAAPVYDEYGCNDGGIIALTCPRGRFHLAENVSLVEILDGERTCPPGVEGDIVVTNLHAHVLPFLRYRIGDRGVLSDGPCPCGRLGQVLERLTGRSGDSLSLPDGSSISYVTFGPIFWETPHIRRWQIVQEVVDRVTVRLDVEDGFTEEEAGIIRAGIHARSGGQLAVDIRLDDPIVRTGGGKQRVVINSLQQVGP